MEAIGKSFSLSQRPNVANQFKKGFWGVRHIWLVFVQPEHKNSLYVSLKGWQKYKEHGTQTVCGWPSPKHYHASPWRTCWPSLVRMEGLVAYRREAAWRLTPTSQVTNTLSHPVPEVTLLSIALLGNPRRLTP